MDIDLETLKEVERGGIKRAIACIRDFGFGHAWTKRGKAINDAKIELLASLIVSGVMTDIYLKMLEGLRSPKRNEKEEGQ